MQTFEIKEEFLVDGKPTKLISGAIHYFRMTPAQWEDSLYNGICMSQWKASMTLRA